MKTFRMFSIAMAVVILVTAAAPFVATSATAQKSANITEASAAQTFVEAARGLPLLAPMSIVAPVITMNVENAGTSAYSCEIVKQSPKDWTKMKSRQYFDMSWTIKNTGAVWHAGTTKFSYINGAKMQTRGDSFRIEDAISRGRSIKLTVDMIAPKGLGTYTTLWGIFSGNQRLCKVTFVLTVVR